ncbi:hypothetical protein BDV38DRAFT_5513 [Aspergillus pseudotamarii]|uniref:Zn(2)-C6 fungal-type domain-containing protein n=1 Tax=Aspergillus pseudotamarii TaxID=132259 RepID=A0A5N6TCH6_ASPPS|nr:uncharacterized protein BDV38DRAFT_5513 [Aspergillus pseudotamarii]KAE8143970.1 hypothetical protein BDV38DRAFT_5513 [Aspergillus pseudotamarii]
MKFKSQAVCQPCRDRKIGCDGKRPACTQCLHFREACPGYQQQHVIFVHQAPGATRNNTDLHQRRRGIRPAPRGVSSATGNVLLNFTKFRWSTAEELLAVAIDHFIPGLKVPVSLSELYTSQSLVCASWLDALPHLINEERYGSLLLQTVRTLGLSILCKEQAKKECDSQRLRCYCSAIHQLRSRLLLSDDHCREQTVAAIMSLTLAELVMPTSQKGWIAHVRAVGEIMRIIGPDQFTVSTAHRLFVGFRPIILIEAILSRTPTFLELNEWQSVPFQKHFPSPMQQLLSCAAVLPSLLQQTDSVKQVPPQNSVAERREVALALTKILMNLQQWELSYKNSFREPLYWPKSKGATSGDTSIQSFWFPNALTATALIHSWAFQIICRAQIDQLEGLNRVPRGFGDLDTGSTFQILEGPVDFSIRICQSMDYFLDDQMKIYGPAAAIFPFQIAYETLLLYLRPYSNQVKVCKAIIVRFSQKGFDVKPSASQ